MYFMWNKYELKSELLVCYLNHHLHIHLRLSLSLSVSLSLCLSVSLSLSLSLSLISEVICSRVTMINSYIALGISGWGPDLVTVYVIQSINPCNRIFTIPLKLVNRTLQNSVFFFLFYWIAISCGIFHQQIKHSVMINRSHWKLMFDEVH